MLCRTYLSGHPIELSCSNLQESARQRAAAALFDKSLLVDFGEQMQYDAPATQLTPLVREAGRMVVTDQRVYFQPLHNVTGGSPVLSHPLSAVAAVAHRNSSLRPIGDAPSWCYFLSGLGMMNPCPACHV